MNTFSAALLTFAFSMVMTHAAKNPTGDAFTYDPANETIQAEVLDNANFYDASIVLDGKRQWLAWLEYVPGKSDQLWLGVREGDKWVEKRVIASGELANPTVVRDVKGRFFVTYEAGIDTNWDLFVINQDEKGEFRSPRKISTDGSDIKHVSVAASDGGIWVVWQSDRDGQFDIVARNVSAELSDIVIVSDSLKGDWHPSATVTGDGTLCVAWDSYDGSSFNVLARTVRSGKLGKVIPIAASPAFEGRVQLVADKKHVWAAWEEDGENWGKRYTAREPGLKESTKLTDVVGPLHRFRQLHLAKLNPETLDPTAEVDIPQRSLQLATSRSNAPADVKKLGAFYERAKLTIDEQGRLWVVYHHYYTPWMGFQPIHHVENDWGIYARCLAGETWSKLFRFDVGQGDAMQRLSVVPAKEGFCAVWTTGRTDRRHKNDERPRGVAIGTVSLGTAGMGPKATMSVSKAQTAKAPKADAGIKLTDSKQKLFFGDLHRHTDLSLCYSPSDGTIEDAYRYAIDVAPLDFLGVTDHTHDLQMGDPLSHLWWRTRKESDRHQLRGKFVPFYSYERSRGETDHNVISLRNDMMRPHLYSHAEFWKELDTDTITIPHEPFARVLWEKKDDTHRPVMEMYQGYRHMAGEDAGREGLLKGHHFGFIASSDHLSTMASFACVWAEKPTRESIFRALQARRTYAATDKIQLKVTSGGHWMGEKFEAIVMQPLAIEIVPTAEVEKLDIFIDGKIKTSRADLALGDGRIKTVWNAPKDLSGEHIIWVRLTQKDGNRAWSSPMWVNIQP